MKIKNIRLIHIGEDYSTYSFENEEGKLEEVEITGFAQIIINTLGEQLLGNSFIEKQ